MVVDIDLTKTKIQNQDGHQKTKWPPKHKIDHNSVNFQANSSRLCMAVYKDLPQKNVKTKMAAKKQNDRQNTKLFISHSIFKLGAPDLAW